MAVSDQDKNVVSGAYSEVGHSVSLKIDDRRLKGMRDSEFQSEVESLSNEIMKEITDMKKRYYEDGFKDALKKVQAQSVVSTQVSAPVVEQAPVHSFVPDTTVFESKIVMIENKLSDRITALEQSSLNSQERDEELKGILNENKELVSTLKGRLADIAMLQSSIDEKLSQNNQMGEQFETLSTELRTTIDEKISQQDNSSIFAKLDAISADVSRFGDMIIEQDSKLNKFERNRASASKRVERRFKTVNKKLEDFKKVRRAIRKQGKRITLLTETSVEKKSFYGTLKRLRAAKGVTSKKTSKKKVTISVKKGARKTATVRTSKKTVKKTTKVTKSKKGKETDISIKSDSPTTVEINNK